MPCTVGFDASGLMQYAYAGAGIKLPRSSGEMYRVGQKILPQQARRGDLIFYGPEGTQSVAMYLGNNQMLEVGDVVQVSPVRANGMTPYLVRVLGTQQAPLQQAPHSRHRAASAGAAGAIAAADASCSRRQSSRHRFSRHPSQQAPVQQAPSQQVPTQQAPLQQLPLLQSPTPLAPVQQVPVQQAPVQPLPRGVLSRRRCTDPPLAPSSPRVHSSCRTPPR